MADSLTLPQVLTGAFAYGGDKNAIANTPSTTSPQLANIQTGFPAITQVPTELGGIPPERGDFNGIFNLLSSFYYYTQNGGVYTFEQTVSDAIGGYPKGATLYYTDSNGATSTVRSLMNNNTFNFNLTPSYIDDGEHWKTVSTRAALGQVVGSIFAIPATDSYIPTGCVPCDGSEYTRSQYADFFDDWLIGRTVSVQTYAYGPLSGSGMEGYLYFTKETPAVGDWDITHSYYVTQIGSYPNTLRVVSANGGDIQFLNPATSQNKVQNANVELLKTCSYTEYNEQIATYGQCGMIALNTTNNTFKVPTIKDGAVIEQCGSDNVGQAYKESLPNLKGTGYLVDLANKSGTSQNATLAIQGGLGSGAFWVNGIGTGGSYDASLSSSVYQDGAKVQTDNVRMRYFIVLATGSINQSQFDWAQYQSSLALKASKDLSDITTAGKSTAVSWCMPDYTAGVAISGITTANTSFSVPKDGILYIKMSSISFLGSVFVDDMVACSLANASVYTGISVSFMPIAKGTHTFRSEKVDATSITFYPYKGA